MQVRKEVLKEAIFSLIRQSYTTTSLLPQTTLQTPPQVVDLKVLKWARLLSQVHMVLETSKQMIGLSTALSYQRVLGPNSET